MNYRFVFDTNTVISAALLKASVSARALDYALEIGRISLSEPVLEEFIDVIFRKKFDRYFLNENERLEAIRQIEQNALFFFPKEKINVCRDVKDDKFLELAVAAKANCIITGDQDLLVLQPFRSIQILTPSEFLNF